MLRIRSKFESMLLIKEVLIIVIWPLVRAKMETINLTVFLYQILNNIKIKKKQRNVPKVVFKRPLNILLARSAISLVV